MGGCDRTHTALGGSGSVICPRAASFCLNNKSILIHLPFGGPCMAAGIASRHPKTGPRLETHRQPLTSRGQGTGLVCEYRKLVCPLAAGGGRVFYICDDNFVRPSDCAGPDHAMATTRATGQPTSPYCNRMIIVQQHRPRGSRCVETHSLGWPAPPGSHRVKLIEESLSSLKPVASRVCWLCAAAPPWYQRYGE